MYELLLTPSSSLDLASLLDYAARLGLDLGRFRDELLVGPRRGSGEQQAKARLGEGSAPEYKRGHGLRGFCHNV